MVQWNLNLGDRFDPRTADNNVGNDDDDDNDLQLWSTV